MKKENKIFLIIFLIILGLAIMDILSIPLWGNETLLSFFWGFATLVIVIASVVWLLATNDKSEAIAIGVGAKLATMFLLEDTLFYLIKLKQIGEASMPHLYNHYLGNIMARILGHTAFTPTTLIITNIIGGTIIYFTVKYLIKNGR